MVPISMLKFDVNGLIPVIVQDVQSKEVLMMAYMNEEAIRVTLERNFVTFWSRSRQMLWQKGETSGNVMQVISIVADCDSDTLLIQVKINGPACHMDTRTCFLDTDGSGRLLTV